jgi:hypothetical protein
MENTCTIIDSKYLSQSGQIVKLAYFGPEQIKAECNFVTDIVKKAGAKTYVIDDFTDAGNFMIFPRRECDIFHPLKLIISGDMTKLNCLNNFGFTAFTKDKNILLYPIDFLISVHTLERTDDYIVLDISKSPYFNNWQTFNFIHMNFIIDFHTKHNFKISMCFETIYADTEQRRLSAHKYTQMMKYHELIKSDNITNKFNIDSTLVGLTKGLFVKCSVDQLENIKIITNSEFEMLCYGKMEIKHFCKKLNDGLLYVPFDLSYSIDDDTFESYQYGINFSRFAITKFELNFTEPQNGLQLYSDSFNYLTFTDVTNVKIFPLESILYDISFKFTNSFF